ncbi:MAG: aminoglycoside phosphotransferase, partial [Paenibacillus sp.]|nr:aminoglycoside phosphotransferase [Paenibacillus sp.]
FILGKLHKAASEFVPMNDKRLPRYDDPAGTLQVIQEVEFQFKDRIKPGQQKVLDYIKQQCTEISLHVPDEVYWGLPSLIIHGDYHPANIKYSDGKVSGVFDFDWASLQPRVRDIVDGIAYFAARRKHLIDGGDIYSLTQSCRMDMKRSLLFINGYLISTSAPLHQQEIEALPYLVASRLITSRVLALRKIPEEHKLAMLTKGIEKQIRWLEDNRNEFLGALTKVNKI